MINDPLCDVYLKRIDTKTLIIERKENDCLKTLLIRQQQNIGYDELQVLYSVHTVTIPIALREVLALMLTCSPAQTVRLSAAWGAMWPPVLRSSYPVRLPHLHRYRIKVKTTHIIQTLPLNFKKKDHTHKPTNSYYCQIAVCCRQTDDVEQFQTFQSWCGVFESKIIRFLHTSVSRCGPAEPLCWSGATGTD